MTTPPAGPRDHTVYVNPRWLENPHDHQHVAGCTTCGWREETVTVEHAKLLAVKHIRENRDATRQCGERGGVLP